MDAIKNNQLKAKKKDDKTKGIVYLSKGLNRLIKLYPGSLDANSLNILEKFAIYEKKIDYKNLSYKILFQGFIYLMKLIFKKNMVCFMT